MSDELAGKMKELLGLDRSPIAVAFSNEAPPGVNPMEGSARLCEMLDIVRFEGKSFSTIADNQKCDGGASSCGLREPTERSKSGEFLFHDLGLFASRRAARRFSNSTPRIEFGTVKVVSFAPWAEAAFEPDVVVLVCTAKQGMKIAEAFVYESGNDPARGLTGPPICSAVVAAPFLLGGVFYSLGDFGVRKFMKIKDEDIFVGISAERLPEIVRNLEKRKFA